MRTVYNFVMHNRKGKKEPINYADLSEDDLGYIPGSFDESAFLSGRGFVGQQITKAINTPVKD